MTKTIIKIQSKSQLQFFIAADRIMNGLSTRISFRERLLRLCGFTMIYRGVKL